MSLCQSSEESKSVHLTYNSRRQISPQNRCRSPKLEKTEDAYWVDANKYICRKCGYAHEVVKSPPNNEIKNQEYSKGRVVGSHEDSKAVKASQPYFNDQDTESVADNFDYLKTALGNHISMGASTKEMKNQRSQFTLQDRERDVYDGMLKIKYSLSFLDPHGSVSARPDIYSVWRGCFRIKNGKHETTMRLVAHMSSKARSEILYMACALQPVIDATILPKSDAWLKSFRKSGPEDGDIGLYFFPEGGWDEKVYFRVLDEMIRQEFALKAMIQDWELRVLYSRELPMEHWRVQQQYYLWGSFRT